MAKKVVISDKELEPTVLYKIKKKRFGFIRLILLFAIFIGVVIYLPDIDKYVQAYKRGEAELSVEEIIGIFYKGNKTTQPKTDTNTDVDIDDSDKKYSFDENTVIVNGGFNVKNFKIDGDVLSFEIINNSSEAIDLKGKKYFLTAYDEEDNIIVTTKIKEVVLKPDVAVTQDVIISNTNISYFTLVEKSLDEYPTFEFAEGSTALICSKTGEMITYSYTDGLLTSIRKVTRVNTTDDTVLPAYSAGVDGYDIQVNKDDNGTTYITTIDNNVVDETNMTGDYYYPKNTLPKVIKYEMELKDYSCK